MKLIPIYEVGSNRVIGWENRTSPNEFILMLSKPLLTISYSTSVYNKNIKWVHIHMGAYTLLTISVEFWRLAQLSPSFYKVVVQKVRTSYNNIIL